MDEHRHKWQVFQEPDKLVCPVNGCRTVADIATVIANAESVAAHQMKVRLLADQLFKRELKKPAHDAAYAWVSANAPAATLKAIQPAEQGALL